MKLNEAVEGTGFVTRLTGRYGRVQGHDPGGVKVWWLDKRCEQYLHPDVIVNEVDLLGVPEETETVA